MTKRSLHIMFFSPFQSSTKCYPFHMHGRMSFRKSACCRSDNTHLSKNRTIIHSCPFSPYTVTIEVPWSGNSANIKGLTIELWIMLIGIWRCTNPLFIILCFIIQKFKTSLIIHEDKTKEIHKDTLAVFDIFLAGFYGSHKVNLQNFYVNELTKWFVFEAVQ